MPFSTFDDLPDNVKTFLRSAGATAAQIRQWIEVFNSCWERFKDEGRCIRMANGVLSRRLRQNRLGMSLSVDNITDGEHNGRAAWFVPTIFTREGIQNRHFKPWEELTRAVWSLEGAPVTWDHPHGLSVMTSPDIIIGEVAEARADEENRALVGQVAIWKDDPRAQALIKGLRDNIASREGSVGFTTQIEPSPGTFEGRPFLAIERNIFFDHYAVNIPHGACTAPACGLLLNGEEEEVDVLPPVDPSPPLNPNPAIPPPPPTPDVARGVLVSMNIFDEGSLAGALSDSKLVEDLNCVPCSKLPDALKGIDEVVWGDQRFTFSPPWSEVDKTGLPASAYMVVGDPEKKTTWKLPYKNPDGAVNCNAVRAIIQVLGGARGGVDLTTEQLRSVRRRAASLWRSCLALRERGENMAKEGFIKQVLYITEHIKNGEDDNMADNASAELESKVAELTALVAEKDKSIAELTSRLTVFENAEKARAEAELEALRTEVAKSAKDIFSEDELKAMNKEQLTVAKKSLAVKVDSTLKGGAAPADTSYTTNAVGTFRAATLPDLYKKPMKG